MSVTPPLTLKEFVKKITPKKILASYRRIGNLLNFINCVLYDCECFIKSRSQKREGLICSIMAGYHVVEKGITMPGRRLGFGKELIIQLIDKCLLFIELYGKKHEQLRYAISIIAEYKNIHDRENFVLDHDISNALKKYLICLMIFNLLPIL
jgi:hypothetical protein